MEHCYRKFTCSGPALFLFQELESKQAGVRLLVSLPSTLFTQLLCGYSMEIKHLAENSLVRMSEDVLVLTLQLLSLSCFQIFIYTAPFHFKRDFRIRANRLTLIGQGQKLVNVVFRDVSQGQALSNWDKNSQRTEEGKRKKGRDRKCCHILGGLLGLVTLACLPQYLRNSIINIPLTLGNMCGGGEVGSRLTPSDSPPRIVLGCWKALPPPLHLFALSLLFGHLI